MKKGFYAIIFLLGLAFCSWKSIIKTEELCGQMAALTEDSYNATLSGDWDKAEYLAEKALDYWNSQENYTHIFLRHSDVDKAEESLYKYLAVLYQRENGKIKAAAMEACTHYSSLLSMERVRLGSIF